MEIQYSVIVPTYNRGEGLRACLESLVHQEASQFEIIVVDDCSKVDPRSFLTQFMAQYPHIPFQYVRQEKNGGHGKARNAGMHVARGSLILFTDDDCVLPPHWIGAHVDAHARYPEAAGVGGWYWSPQNRRTTIYDRFFELQFEYSYTGMRDCEVWTNTMYSPSGNTANMSYKTEPLRSLGGFDEKIYFTGGIDWELKAHFIATGHSLVSIPLAIEHTKQFNLKTFLIKTVKLGRGMDYMATKYPSLNRPSLNSAVSLYGTWKTSPVTKGECASIALLWGLALIPGKWINRLLRFAPTEVFEMRNTRYFTYRYTNGVRTTLHDVMPFDPKLSEDSFARSLETQSGGPRYSVIIPTFNRKELLLEALNAVLKQEDVPAHMFEIIVVDDGSTDGTMEAVVQLQKEHPTRLLRYHAQKNAGASRARNTGASLAHGSILFFTDSDCVVPKKWLWTKLQAYEQHPDIVGTGGG